MIILDTNLVSELMKPAPDPDVYRWVARQPPLETRVTAITRAEILYGIESLPPGKRRTAIAAAAKFVFDHVPAPVLPFDADAAAHFARIAASRKRIGQPIGLMDAQIAAIALSHGATLATRDEAGFAHCGVRIANPWRR